MLVSHFFGQIMQLIDERRVGSFARESYNDEQRVEAWYSQHEPKRLRRRWHYTAASYLSVSLLSLSLLVCTAILSPAPENDTVATWAFGAHHARVENAFLVCFVFTILFTAFRTLRIYANTNLALSTELEEKCLFLSLISIFFPLIFNTFFRIVWV